jgi:hypothetical protein
MSRLHYRSLTLEDLCSKFKHNRDLQGEQLLQDRKRPKNYINAIEDTSGLFSKVNYQQNNKIPNISREWFCSIQETTVG